MFLAYKGHYLFCHSENCVLVYDLATGEWMQTLNLKRPRSLCAETALLSTNNGENFSLVYLRDTLEGSFDFFLGRFQGYYFSALSNSISQLENAPTSFHTPFVRNDNFAYGYF